MEPHTLLFTLAQIDPGGYFSFPKLITIAALFIGWAFVCQWVDIDTETVKTKREQWNLIVLSGGIAGIVVLLLMPWPGNLFFLGLAFYLLLAGGGALAYIVHRNGRVVKNSRVLTLGHAKRLLASAKGEKKEKEDKGIRVILATDDGKAIKKPDDPEAATAWDDAQDFLFDVFWRRATEVDLAVGSDKVRLVHRIDGVAAERTDGLSAEAAERVIQFLKKNAGLNPEERRRPQVGRIRATLLAHSTDMNYMEVKTSGSTAGERLQLKVQATAQLKRLSELGIPEPRLEKLRELIKAPSGLLLFSGPRQSGVTTTQYAVLREHDAFMQNLHAVEKAPLREIDNITQHKYKNEPEVSYARQLQTVLRREPDIVMVGECEDRETAQIACRAATEDKKIYLAIEGHDCIDALGRFMALVEEPQMVSKAMLGVVNQRLIRVLCTTCRQSYKPDESLLRKANLPVDKIDTFYRQPTEPVFDKKGREIVCQTCQGTGYVGRAAVFEIMPVDKTMKAMIADGSPMKAIKAQARKNRMYYLQEEGLMKVIDGTTSLNEVLRGMKVEGG